LGKNKQVNIPYPLILASTSKYRTSLLAQLGWPFENVAPCVDEDIVKKTGLLPYELAHTLSVMKAQAVFIRYPDTCVIGSDQVCHLEGEILGKPGTVQKACDQLAYMQGKTHELITSVTVMNSETTISFSNITRLTMRELSTAEIESYVLYDKPLDCAGSYMLESRGIKLFSKIEMNDHTAIIGLPLVELTSTLLKLGYSF
jgi:septum formation protein